MLNSSAINVVIVAVVVVIVVVIVAVIVVVVVDAIFDPFFQSGWGSMPSRRKKIAPYKDAAAIKKPK